MKKRSIKLILSLLREKTDPYNDKNAIEFRWSGVKEEEDIAMANFNESLQKQADEEIFPKK